MSGKKKLYGYIFPFSFSKKVLKANFICPNVCLGSHLENDYFIRGYYGLEKGMFGSCWPWLTALSGFTSSGGCCFAHLSAALYRLHHVTQDLSFLCPISDQIVNSLHSISIFRISQLSRVGKFFEGLEYFLARTTNKMTVNRRLRAQSLQKELTLQT